MPTATKRKVSVGDKERSTALPKAEQSVRTRTLIIDTGISCLAEFGYAKTSLNLISQQAGISRGPLHYHFTDKNDLMGAIAEALPQRISPASIERLQVAGPIANRINALVDLGIDEHLGDHHFVAIELLIAARRDPALARCVLPHLAKGEQAVDRWWVAYAAALNWEEERLIAFRWVFVAALRGLAIDHIEQQGRSSHSRAAAMLKEVMVQFVLTARPPTS